MHFMASEVCGFFYAIGHPSRRLLVVRSFSDDQLRKLKMTEFFELIEIRI